MKYSQHVYTFLHFISPSKLSYRECTNMVELLKNVLESVDAVEAILATCAIDKKKTWICGVCGAKYGGRLEY